MFIIGVGEMAEENKDEVTITYETLYELLKREKDRTELQKLDDSFLSNLLRYLKDKHAIITKEQTDLFSIEEKDKTEKQLENIKRIVADLYSRREKKIISMAIDKSRNKSSILDNSLFLKEEKQLFNILVDLLDKNRESVLFNLLDFKEPTVINFSLGKQESYENKEAKREKEITKETKLVRFLHAVPKFVGKELEEYGPFDEEDIASLPIQIADVLINKGRAEEIKEN